jgi:hypothetical protein
VSESFTLACYNASEAQQLQHISIAGKLVQTMIPSLLLESQRSAISKTQKHGSYNMSAVSRFFGLSDVSRGRPTCKFTLMRSIFALAIPRRRVTVKYATCQYVTYQVRRLDTARISIFMHCIIASFSTPSQNRAHSYHPHNPASFPASDPAMPHHRLASHGRAEVQLT